MAQVTTTYSMVGPWKSKQEPVAGIDYPLIFNEFNMFFADKASWLEVFFLKAYRAVSSGLAVAIP